LQKEEKYIFTDFISFDFETRHRNATNIFSRIRLYIQVYFRNRKFIKIVDKFESKMKKYTPNTVQHNIDSFNKLSGFIEQLLKIFTLMDMQNKNNFGDSKLGQYYIKSCNKLRERTLEFQKFLDAKATGVNLN
jgi:hypothetical protein